MNITHSSFDFAGFSVQAFLCDGKVYATPGAFVDAIGTSRQNFKNWLQNHGTQKGIPVRVGKRNVPATAYPASVIFDFLQYRTELGDKQATILLRSVSQADFERSANEANGVQVTAAQHEENRAAIRYNLCVEWGIKYEQRDRTAFYATATAEEVELTHKAVHLHRLRANLPLCNDILPDSQKKAFDRLTDDPVVVKLANSLI